MSQFSDELKALSNQTGQSASDLALVAYNAISAGTSTEDAMEMVGAATDLATGGFTSADSALSVLTTALNAYGDAAGSVTDISDSLITVQNLGVTTVDKLASSMGKAIATGSAYGISLGNIESSYISLTKQGISTEEATTYMSGMFNELGNSGSKVSKILKEETGMSFGELMASGMSLADVLGIVYESVDGNSEAMMNLWGSAEAAKASNAIINEGLETFNDNLETLQNSTGATQEAVEAMSQTFEYKSGQIQQSVNNLGIGIYESFQTGLSGSGGVLDMAIGWLDELTTAFTENGPEGLVDAVGSVLSDVIAQATVFAPKLVQLAVSLIQSLLMGIQSNLPQIMEGVVTVINQLVTGFLEMLPLLLDVGLQIILQLAIGIGQALPDLIPAVVEAILLIIETLLSEENLSLLMEAAIHLIGGLAVGLRDGISLLIDPAIEIIKSLVDELILHTAEFLAVGFEALDQLWQGVKQQLPVLIAKIPEVINSLSNKFIGLAVKFLEVGAKIISHIKDSIVSKWQDLQNSVPGWINSLLQKYLSGLAVFANIGTNIVQGIWSGISAGWNWLTDKVGGLAQSLYDTAKKALGINSPSKKFEYLATMCVAGFDKGMDGLMDPGSITRNVQSSIDVMRMNAAGSEGVIWGGSGDLIQNIYIQKEVATADELAREIRLESRYGLMNGTPVKVGGK